MSMSLFLEFSAALLALLLVIYSISRSLRSMLTMSRSPPPLQQTSSSSPKIYPQFLLLGDSITQFCSLTLAARLSEWYSRRLDVINRGFSGYTSPMGYEVLQQFLPDNISPSPAVPRVQLMTVFFGANDACVAGHPQHVHLQTYISSLKAIVQYKALKTHDTKVVLVTPPPVDEWQLDGSDRTAEHTAKYAAAAREVSQELHLPLLDLWTIFMHKAGWRQGSRIPFPGSTDAPRNKALGELLDDGLHFTAAGYDLMFNELVKVIEEDLPDQVPDQLPMIFPDWKDKLGLES